MASRKRRDDISLTKIILGICLVCVIVFGVYRVARWFKEDYVGGALEAAAPSELLRAEEALRSGNLEEARAKLLPIVEGVQNMVVTPQALLLLARVEEQAGNVDQSLAYLKQAATGFADSPFHLQAELAYARALERKGDVEAALALYTSHEQTAAPEMRAPSLCGLARAAERAGDVEKARTLYRQATRDATWNSPDWDEAADGLGRLNSELIFSNKPTPESKVYVVERGDNLINIGMKLNTTQGLLTRANGLSKETTLNVGDRLKYTPKDFRIIIERSTCRLFLLDSDGLFKRYMVGLGTPGHETTLGEFRIGNKQVDPTWFRPNVGPIPPEDPRNELGSRWMPLVPEREQLPTDLGIHGTIAPETIGKYSSSGCARMLNADAEELYDLVVRSTPVEIVETVDPRESGL
ncbi:MAG TPA: L,D-transpeptidase family protein [Candidatus Hydrogenedentes bacterium]|nr:L,D-transpeptidase family protein [Candidatus Hydrogenedentota bacterium]